GRSLGAGSRTIRAARERRARRATTRRRASGGPCAARCTGTRSPRQSRSGRRPSRTRSDWQGRLSCPSTSRRTPRPRPSRSPRPLRARARRPRARSLAPRLRRAGRAAGGLARASGACTLNRLSRIAASGYRSLAGAAGSSGTSRSLGYL
ncbi:hypothetical protein T492DRAFT_1139109, partial [Pavlovales sp. CCMP2436]